MANATHVERGNAAAAPDYARYDRIWQRVAPAMDPYPEVRAARGGAVIPVSAVIPAGAAVPADAASAVPAPAGITAGETAPQAQPAAPGTQSRELALPGAQAEPCCMGTEARTMVAVLEQFSQEETADEATYRQFSRMAPSRTAAAVLRELGRQAGLRAKELAAVHYLITGEEQRAAAAAVVVQPRLSYRAMLRERYHAAVCNGFNYARAEEGTADPCLQRILERFSAENYAAADRLLRLLMQAQ